MEEYQNIKALTFEQRRAPRIAVIGRPSLHVRGRLEVWLVGLCAIGARIR